MRTSRSIKQSFIQELGSRTIVNRLTPARIWTVVALACLGVVLTGSWWNNWMAQGSSPVVRLGLKRERNETYHISGERGSLSEAVSRAEDGDVLVLGEGHFEGDLHLDKRLSIRGSGSGTVIETQKGALEVRSRVVIESLSIQGGAVGLRLSGPKANLTLQNVALRHCDREAVVVTDESDSRLVIKDCIFTDNGTGVRVGNGQVMIVESSFSGHRENAVQIVGNVQTVVSKNTFEDNSGNGLEVYLDRRTYAFVIENRFHEHEKDAIRIFNAPSDANRNVLVVSNNRMEANQGRALAVVEKSDQVLDDRPVRASLWGGANQIDASLDEKFSENVRSLGLESTELSEPVKVVLHRGDDKEEQFVHMQYPIPLGLFAINGLRDAEGIVVEKHPRGLLGWITDDRAESLLWINLRKNEIVQRYPMKELFPTGQFRHPEGVTLQHGVSGTQIFVSDDDAQKIVSMSLHNEALQIRDSISTVLWHRSPEDLEIIHDTMYVIGQHRLTAVDHDTQMVRDGFPIRLDPEGHGGHMAGLSFDGSALLLTTSDNQGSETGTIIQINPLTGDVLNMWSLGSYIRDPRGISSYEGLVFVVDGSPPDARYRLWCFALDSVEDLTSHAQDILIGRTF